MTRSTSWFGGVAGLLAVAAVAGAQVADGSTRTVNFTVTYRAGGTGGNASHVLHVLTGRCVLAADAPAAWGIDGPTRAQEQAMKKQTGSGTMASMEAEVKKCGKDQACLMALMSRMSEDGTMDRAVAESTGGGEANFQVWSPQQCSGTLTVDDVVTRSGTDSMANTAFTETRTLKGTATIADQGQRGWLGLYAQHDLKKARTELRFLPPPDTRVDGTLVRTGYGAKSSGGKEVVLAFPAVAAPVVPGALQTGKTTTPMQGGTVTFEWMVAR